MAALEIPGRTLAAGHDAISCQYGPNSFHNDVSLATHLARKDARCFEYGPKLVPKGAQSGCDCSIMEASGSTH